MVSPVLPKQLSVTCKIPNLLPLSLSLYIYIYIYIYIEREREESSNVNSSFIVNVRTTKIVPCGIFSLNIHVKLRERNIYDVFTMNVRFFIFTVFCCKVSCKKCWSHRSHGNTLVSCEPDPSMHPLHF